MNYQAIRAAVENPLLTAFNALSPAVPVFFDNITAAPKNATTEYVRVNVTFGITNEPTLTGSVDDDEEIYCPENFCQRSKKRDPGFHGPRSAYVECFRKDTKDVRRRSVNYFIFIRIIPVTT